MRHSWLWTPIFTCRWHMKRRRTWTHISNSSTSRRENTSWIGAMKYLYYLEAGTIRLSFPDKEKREISARFIEPKEFINFSLSHKEQLSHYNMKALEHCKVWRLPKRDLQRLYDLSINFNKLARLHLEKSINHKIKREEDFHKLNAEERYKKLMANERWMFRSIPLKDIASYIGITPQALSNIRKRI